MDSNILSALSSLDVSTLSRDDWIKVGMALKEEGFSCSTWDEWSRNDSRYHTGECERKWDSFHGSNTPVKGGTIIQMAMERGWTPFGSMNIGMDWDDVIEYDGGGPPSGLLPPEDWNPVNDLLAYLQVLFDPDDHVGYGSAYGHIHYKNGNTDHGEIKCAGNYAWRVVKVLDEMMETEYEE